MHALVWIGIALVVIWGVLWLGLHIVSGLIHLVIIAGVVLVIMGLVRRASPSPVNKE